MFYVMRFQWKSISAWICLASPESHLYPVSCSDVSLETSELPSSSVRISYWIQSLPSTGIWCGWSSISLARQHLSAAFPPPYSPSLPSSFSSSLLLFLFCLWY
jgi:hypothetical protein